MDWICELPSLETLHGQLNVFVEHAPYNKYNCPYYSFEIHSIDIRYRMPADFSDNRVCLESLL